MTIEEAKENIGGLVRCTIPGGHSLKAGKIYRIVSLYNHEGITVEPLTPLKNDVNAYHGWFPSRFELL